MKEKTRVPKRDAIKWNSRMRLHAHWTHADTEMCFKFNDCIAPQLYRLVVSSHFIALVVYDPLPSMHVLAFVNNKLLITITTTHATDKLHLMPYTARTRPVPTDARWPKLSTRWLASSACAPRESLQIHCLFYWLFDCLLHSLVFICL